MKHHTGYLFGLVLMLHATMLSASDYYWVGGSGNWSDLQHWATSSGGAVPYTQIPTANDDVFFDVNSFNSPNQTVTVNLDNITCRHFSWLGAGNNPVFAGPTSSTLTVYGAFTLITAMQYQFAGDLRFQATTAAQGINFSGKTALRNVLFEGMGGWVLQDNLIVAELLRVRNGTWNTNGYQVDTKFMLWEANLSTDILLGASLIRVSGSEYLNALGFPEPSMLIHSGQVTVTPGTSRLEFTSAMPIFRVDAQGFSNNLNLYDVAYTHPTGPKVKQQIITAGGTCFFNEVSFATNGDLDGAFTANTVRFSAGKKYGFLAGSVFDIGNLIAQGSCTQPIAIQSNGAGQATITKTSGFISIDFISLKDMRAAGGAIFNATNVVDLGNNYGWTLTPRPISTLYWVGGTGNWNDTAHWSNTSGGAGGACLPSGADDVIFDLNSFSSGTQVVTVNVEAANCRNMNWINVPTGVTFDGADTMQLHIFGSLAFDLNMEQQFQGNVFFESKLPGQTITSAGQRFWLNTYFDGAGGEWTLQDSLSVRHAINLLQGTIRTNDKRIYAEKFLSHESMAPRGLYMGNTTIILRYVDTDATPTWTVSGTNFDFQKGTSTIQMGQLPILNGGSFVTYGEAVDYHNVVSLESIYMYQDGDYFTNIDSCFFQRNAQVTYNTNFGYLLLTPGYRYRFGAADIMRIGQLDANGLCDKYISIQSVEAGKTAFFESAVPQSNMSRLSIQDIHINGGTTFTATATVDQGNLSGWTILGPIGRVLYWVGGAGDWLDPAHWSLSSGGPGGECPPGPPDDAIFDQNSFTGPNQIVNATAYPLYLNCHDLIWQNMSFNPTFNAGDLHIYGSMDMSPDMIANLFSIHFITNEPDAFIHSAGHFIRNPFFIGSGIYNLTDAFNSYYLEFQDGTLRTNGFPLTTDFAVVIDGRWELSNSVVSINGQGGTTLYIPIQFVGSGFTLDAGTSTLLLNNAINTGLYSPFPLQFHRIISTSITGSALISALNTSSQTVLAEYIQFYGNARLEAGVTTDSMTLAAGKSYVITNASNKACRVNAYLRAIGNNCKQINISATTAGIRADWVMPDTARIDADFIQMSDQNGTGGAYFYVGSHSTNIANSNQGWIFGSTPGFTDVGVLGPDLASCNGAAVVLSAYCYSPVESYFWNDNSMDTTLTVSMPGIYAVRVHFADNCEIVDTVVIKLISIQAIELGNDTTLCNSQSLLLNVDQQVPGIEYTWNTGATTPDLNVTTAGIYKVNLEYLGCFINDSITVSYATLPPFTLGPDLTRCAGQTATLQAPAAAGNTNTWSDGSNGATLAVTTSGTYALTIDNSGCIGSDTVNIVFNPIPIVALGPDLTRCQGETAALSTAIQPNTNYAWNTGSTGAVLNATQSGTFILTATALGCNRSDTVQVNFNPLPNVVLGADLVRCAGETATLSTAPQANTNYLWNTGVASNTLTINTSGTYILAASANGCSRSDTVTAIFNPIPIVALGPDLTRCQGETAALSTAIQPNTNYLWNTGSTGAALNATQSGTFILTATALGCNRSDTVQVLFNALPNVVLGADLVRCAGETATLSTPPQANTNYLWNTGVASNTLTINTSGTYILAATANGCSRSDTVTAIFNPIPIVALGPDLVRCQGETAALSTAIQPNTNYAWNTGSTGAALNATQSGTFILTATALGCTRSDTVQVQFNALPNVVLGADLVRCVGETATLSTPVQANTNYLWNTGTASNTLIINTSGTYILAATANGCSRNDTLSAVFSPAPTVSLGSDILLCPGENAVLQVLAPGAVLEWSTGATGNSITVNQPGIIWAKASISNCIATDTVAVIALPAPAPFSLGNDRIICGTEPIRLDGPTQTGLSYLWSTNATTNFITANTSGIYALTVTNAEGCTRHDAVSVSFHPPFQISLGPDTTICAGSLLRLSPVPIAASAYNWSNGATTSSILVSASGNYTLTATKDECLASDAIVVTVRECTRFSVYLPNAFSPDDNGVNDFVQPYFDPNIIILNYRFEVYDRWGSLLFTTDDPTAGWDGTARGKNSETGIYACFVRVRYRDDYREETIIKKGDILLVR